MSTRYTFLLPVVLFTLSLLFTTNLQVMAQEDDNFLEQFVFQKTLLEDDYFEHFKQYDFAPIWTQTPENSTFGFLGDSYKRIRIKLISVIKNEEQPNEYFVYGKSNLKGNLCEFQGVVVADYHFFEDGKQAHPGMFKGKLYTKWYVNDQEELMYDFIESGEQGYSNNCYIGQWSLYGGKAKQACHWGDYRIPLSGDLDKGTSEFEPQEKYLNNGWKDYVDGIVNGVDFEASARELTEWWK